jgi:hypothetical protein
MAAGSVVVYQHALEDINQGLIDWDSATILVALVSHGYTPAPNSHSSFSVEIASYVSTASGYAAGTLAGASVARTDDSYVALDADDLTISATEVMKVKYAIAYLDATSRPVFYFDLESTSTTGVEATQVVLQWNANGIIRYSNPN